MADLSPALAAKLARLLPRLASPHAGEVAATAAAMTRTLHQSGTDWHDLAAALTDPSAPAEAEPRGGTEAESEAEMLTRLAENLHARTLGRLAPHQRAFLRSARRLLAAGCRLSPRQAAWLVGLAAIHLSDEADQ